MSFTNSVLHRGVLPAFTVRLVRSPYARELLAWSLLAVALGALEGGVIAVLLKDLFAGTFSSRTLNYSVALLVGAPHFCNLMSFFWARFADGRNVFRLLFWVQLATALCLVLVAMAPTGMTGLPMMIAGAVGARLFWSGIVTLRAPVWRRMYPREARARLTGRFFSLHSVVMAATALAVGTLHDWNGSAYPAVYAAAAILGIGGALVFRSLQIRRDPDGAATDRGPEEGLTAREEAGSARAGWKILREDSPFVRYLFWLSLVHCGNLMAMGPLIAFMSDHLHLAQRQQMLVTTAIPLVLIPFAMPLWSRLFDRGDILHFQAFSSGAFALAILVLGVGAISGQTPWLWGGAVLLGIAYAGGSVGWHLGTHHFAPRGRTLQYMGLHVTLSGARGLLAPLAGMTFYEIIEATAPGRGAWVLTVPLTLCAVGAIGFARLVAAERRAPAATATDGLRRRSRTLAMRAAVVIAVTAMLGTPAPGLGAPVALPDSTQQEDTQEGQGYLVYCPCMGRFGNQVAHLLGAMSTARASGRTLVLPPFIKYRGGETKFVPFEEHFSLAAVREVVPAVTLEQFLSDPYSGETRWPVAERRLYCSKRGEAATCPEPRGNPQKTFWDHHGIEFVDSTAIEVTPVSSAAMVRALSPESHPVVALAGSPGSFPVAAEDRHLQRYLVWSDGIRERGEAFLTENLIRPYLAVHLRNGIDWESACRSERGGVGRAQYMSSPQCGLSADRTDTPDDVITEAICLPGPEEAVRAIRDAQKRFGPFRSVFIGTDNNPYKAEIQAAVGDGVRVVTGDSPTLDLYAFGQGDLMIGNCVSSFSALAVRERRAAGRPSVFFGFPDWTEENAYLGEAIPFD